MWSAVSLPLLLEAQLTEGVLFLLPFLPSHSVFNVKYVDILNRFIQSMCLCVCVAGDLT